MKTTSLSIAIILLGFVMPVSVQAQEEDHPEKKSSLEIFFPVCDFLDESQTNWAILAHGESIVTNYQKVLPRTYGILYSHRLNSKAQMRISFLNYRMSYYPEDYGREIYQSLDVTNRTLFTGSLGCQYLLLLKNSFSFYGLLDANALVGGTGIFLSYSWPTPWEQLREGIKHLDLGLSPGLRAELALPFHFFLSAESKYTWFVFQKPSKRLALYNPPIKASPHILTCKVALGYRF